MIGPHFASFFDCNKNFVNKKNDTALKQLIGQGLPPGHAIELHAQTQTQLVLVLLKHKQTCTQTHLL